MYVFIGVVCLLMLLLVWVCFRLMYFHQQQYTCLHLPVAKQKLY